MSPSTTNVPATAPVLLKKPDFDSDAVGELSRPLASAVFLAEAAGTTAVMTEVIVTSRPAEVRVNAAVESSVTRALKLGNQYDESRSSSETAHVSLRSAMGVGVEVGRPGMVIVGLVVERGIVGMREDKDVVGVGRRVVDGMGEGGVEDVGAGELAGVVEGVGATLGGVEGGAGAVVEGAAVVGGGGDGAGELGGGELGGGELGGGELGGGEEGGGDDGSGGGAEEMIGGAAVVGGAVVGGAAMVVDGATEVGGSLGATVDMIGGLVLITGGGDAGAVVTGGTLGAAVVTGGAVGTGDDTTEEIAEVPKSVDRSNTLKWSERWLTRCCGCYERGWRDAAGGRGKRRR